jgi:two-component system, sensor histidine kinase
MSPRERPLVLVVDDNDASRFIKSQVVRRAGYEVVEAATGKGALEAARRQPVDIVLLDVHLPDMSGIEVCAQIKADEALSSVQVLQISATAIADADRVRGLTSGADAYLIEPGNPEVLAATLGALMRARRAELELAEALDREREAREIAERANRLKDEFLAVLSHELRTPLNAMVGWISQLRRGTLDEAARSRALDALDRSAHVQWRLVNELLDSASIAEGKLRLEISPIDLQTVIAAAVESVRAEAARRQVEIGIETRGIKTTGDAGRLQQVATNLLNNAVQFTPAGGRVLITVEAADGWAVIRVEDTGAGIDPDVLPHIFERFRQGSGFRQGHAGLGLGLSITRQVVQMHGGTVTAESAGLNRGAVFTVRIPISPIAEPGPPADSASQKTAADV